MSQPQRFSYFPPNEENFIKLIPVKGYVPHRCSAYPRGTQEYCSLCPKSRWGWVLLLSWQGALQDPCWGPHIGIKLGPGKRQSIEWPPVLYGGKSWTPNIQLHLAGGQELHGPEDNLCRISKWKGQAPFLPHIRHLLLPPSGRPTPSFLFFLEPWPASLYQDRGSCAYDPWSPPLNSLQFQKLP